MNSANNPGKKKKRGGRDILIPRREPCQQFRKKAKKKEEIIDAPAYYATNSVSNVEKRKEKGLIDTPMPRNEFYQRRRKKKRKEKKDENDERKYNRQDDNRNATSKACRIIERAINAGMVGRCPMSALWHFIPSCVCRYARRRLISTANYHASTLRHPISSVNIRITFDAYADHGATSAFLRLSR